MPFLYPDHCITSKARVLRVGCVYVFTIQHEASSKNIQVICKFNVLGKYINS